MINVKQAVGAAIAYVNDFADLLPVREVRLEETEFVEDEDIWLITLSFVDNPMTGSRSYKVFVIDALNGQIKSMKARSAISTR
jgi:hypothetical protein